MCESTYCKNNHNGDCISKSMECINDPKWIYEWGIEEIEHRIATFIHGLYPEEQYEWLLQERDRLKGDAP